MHCIGTDVGRQVLLWALVGVIACESKPKDCPPLFGAPTENTGLDSDRCTSSCPCAETPLEPKVFSSEELDPLDAATLTNPPELLTADPYADPPPATHFVPMVCAVLPDPSTPGAYSVISYPETDSLADHGAILTHTGACGACSSLRDLGVYARIPDLTSPVRQCAARELSGGRDTVLDCLRELGFSEPCALIWYYNARNTRTHCLAPCLENLEEPYHLADGSLNECLQCDEDYSGPVFKAVAGRTRRNSGLPTAICRPCDTVSPVAHDYRAIGVGP